MLITRIAVCFILVCLTITAVSYTHLDVYKRQVTNFAEKLGISKAYGDLLPEGKVNHLEELRQDEANRIAFVCDEMCIRDRH